MAHLHARGWASTAFRLAWALGKWVLSPLCVTVAAQLAPDPSSWHLQQFAPVSLAANLVVVPLLGAAVSLGLLTVLTGPWWPLAGALFNGANYLVLNGLMGAVDAFGSPLRLAHDAETVRPHPGPGGVDRRASGLRRGAPPGAGARGPPAGCAG